VLTAGERLGAFEITGRLGAGGMGEVWRATDTRLGRHVALKLLPEDLAVDGERQARFEREARVLASLSHPHIATLYGLEEAGGRQVLAMELVEGDGLDERIARGPVPIEEALPIATQIAEALEAAHEKGIVHRDLKPANVKLTPEGSVKVLDFGLAKAWETDASEASLSLSPTITRQHTRAGVILGTAAYMAPEQARGKPIDKRADIWALGVVLFEMLSGRRLFEGEMVTDVLANVLKQEIDWDSLPDTTPDSLRRVLRRCLERQPGERIRDVGDVRWELAEVARSGGTVPATEVRTSVATAAPRRALLPWIALAVVTVALVAVAASTLLRPAPRARTVRSFIVPPEKTTFAFQGSIGGPVLSPDGSKLVFVARDPTGKTSLWVRPLDSLSAQELGHTEGASFPFWSPDSRWVAFFVSGKLRKIDVAGGPPESVCDAPSGRGGSWSPEGVIVFAPAVFGGLQRVSSAGGTPAPLSELDRSKQQTSQRWPAFLPDGRHFVYWAGGPLNSGEVKTDGIYIGSLDGGPSSFLLPADSDALYSPPGYLAFLRAQTLMAQPFDATARKLTGEAFPIAEDVSSPENYRLGTFTVSQEGTLAYQTGETGLAQVVWLDASGRQVGSVGDPASIDGFRLSPDGKYLVEQVSDTRSKNVDLWVVDLERNVRTRFTFDAGLEITPVWSPDGSRIAYTANPKGSLDLLVKNANGSGSAQLLLGSEASKYASDWSPDGSNLTVTVIDPQSKTLADIFVMPLSGDHQLKPFLKTPFSEGNAVFSPDGRWLAYQSDESGRSEVYLTPFPGPGGKWQVSQNGGTRPLWRHGGGAVFYLGQDGTLFEASVVEHGAAVEVGTPRVLFQGPRMGTSATSRPFAVAPQGDRYLFLKPVENVTTPLTLVTHWTEGIRR
jgi:eukaryotic-like serine/threonine-protein kinase